jgi:flagellar motor switch protein FliG
MSNFERIGTLKKQKLQSLLQDVTPRDLAISLKNTGESVREAILDNVSETKLKMVQEDFSSLPPMKVDDVEAAQHRILKRLEELYPEESPMPVARSLKNRTA